jgi:hypothetical protein
VKASLNQLKEEVDRCSKILNGLDKLKLLHSLFTTNILLYQRYLIEDLAYELKTKRPVQVSENAERAIGRWFTADGDLAALFLKHLGDSSPSEARLSGAAAQLQRLAASRLTPVRRSCSAVGQLVPRSQ